MTLNEKWRKRVTRCYSTHCNLTNAPWLMLEWQRWVWTRIPRCMLWLWCETLWRIELLMRCNGKHCNLTNTPWLMRAWQWWVITSLPQCMLWLWCETLCLTNVLDSSEWKHPATVYCTEKMTIVVLFYVAYLMTQLILADYGSGQESTGKGDHLKYSGDQEFFGQIITLKRDKVTRLMIRYIKHQKWAI